MFMQNTGHFYLLSSSKNIPTNSFYMPSSWAVKRISSTSGGGSAGTHNANFNYALAKNSSVPGESEVLWLQNIIGGIIDIMLKSIIYSIYYM